MRGCIIATVVLCAVVLLVAVNAIYVNHIADELAAALDELPDLPDPATTPEEVAEIRRLLRRHETCLSLSVNYTLPDRILESLSAMEEHAQLGDRFQYAATRAILRDLCEDLARAERFRVENIF